MRFPPSRYDTHTHTQLRYELAEIIIVNAEGIPIKTTPGHCPQNDLAFLRVLCKKNEIMIAPVKDYFFIVIQNPSD
uniref:Roadblock/LAMTOR2 domain-containing protein n=1 Tax=Oncorhynchus mykiss TaxID=8022 RepID=A0A8K9UZP1_ONCMY